MAAKKAKKVVPLEQYSKSALIALVKKLQREVTRLKALVDVPPLKVTHVEPNAGTVSDLAPHDEPGISEDLERRALAADQQPEAVAARLAGAFPWEKK